MKRNSMLAAAIALALAGAGCTTMNTVENADRQGHRNMVSDSRVITDGTLNKRVNVVGINAATMPNGILKIQVELQNRTNHSQTFFSTVEWFDMDGMKVSTAGGGWAERQILARESLMVIAVAPSPECKDFRLKLMENPR